MKSNGFGSFIQKIVVRVNQEYADEAREALQATVKDVTEGHTDLIWTTKSTRSGDDETIVFELGYLLKIPDGAWEIVWSESKY
ncbi:MAG: hypothetical protein ACK4NR_11480 [Micavibrio sp.]